ncbi:Rrf2 family transcriptional regulator [Candidatus Poribacteria bacterium]|nr:Rrf2 family transcriptional regulator [Candidatus Poribacteria bacterium]
MKLSTRARYGARLMLDLAIHYNKGQQLLKDIAQRQSVSDKYLWQLINPLKVAGLVSSTRGAHGGYNLAKKPSDITLREIIETLEGPLCIVECVDNPEICDKAEECVTIGIWEEASNRLKEFFESISLQDMVEMSES